MKSGPLNHSHLGDLKDLLPQSCKLKNFDSVTGKAFFLLLTIFNLDDTQTARLVLR